MTLALIGRDAELETLRRTVGDGRPILVVGRSGVGKTRLFEALGEDALTLGWQVEFLRGSMAATTVPFGVTAHLLPVEHVAPPHLLLQVVVRQLEERHARQPLLLMVDDAHTIDASSLLVVERLLEVTSVPVVLSVRSGQPLPDLIDHLWVDGRAEVVTIDPLDRSTNDVLVGSLLGGEVGTPLLRELWERTDGIPLYVRELVRTALASGAIGRDEDHVWRLLGGLTHSEHLEGLIATRLASELSPSDRGYLDALCLAEPISLRHASELVGQEALERLERLGIVSVTDGLARLPHPLFGEVLRASMPVSRMVRLTDQVATVVLRSEPSRQDTLRVAALQLATSGAPAPDLALPAAAEAMARLDFELAERLLLAAGGDEFEGQVLLGEARRAMGRSDDAENVLAAAAAAATAPQDVGRVAIARARNQMWNRRDPASAVAVLRDAMQVVGTQVPRAALSAEIALYHGVDGSLDRALDVARDTLEMSDLDPLSELNAIVVHTLGQAVLGLPDGFDDLYQRGIALVSPDGVSDPMAADQLMSNRLNLALFMTPARASDDARQQASRGTPMAGVFWTTCAIGELLHGDIADATRAGREACAQLARADPFANLPMARCILGLAIAHTGDVEATEQADGRMDREAVVDARVAVWSSRFDAHRRAIGGDLAGAGAVAAAGGRRALDDAHVTWGAGAVHDAVRFGMPHLVIEELNELVRRSPLPLMHLYRDHGLALHDGDAFAIEQVARGFAAMGSDLLSAEAYAQAASCHEAAGATTRAMLTAARSSILADRCTAARTPALADAPKSLTPREREIARLSHGGATNREIAEMLVLSLRTVENHLSRVYRRLGLAGREELATVFDVRDG